MTDVTEEHAAYTEMRADGSSAEVAAALAGVSLEIAREWDAATVTEKDGLAERMGEVAEELIGWLDEEDAAEIAGLLLPITDVQELYALVVVLGQAVLLARGEG